MRPLPTPPRPPACRGLVGLLGLLLLTACGAREEPVSGTLREDPATTRAHLVVEGAPREMGRAQGRLLRARIHAFHEAWQKALIAEDGDLLSPTTRARRRDLLALLEPARRTLPEAALQELEGIAEGSGLPFSTLLLSEMLTDLLRFGSEARPLVAGRVERVGEREAWLGLEGPLALLLQEHLVWITRRGASAGGASGAPVVTVLAWPGSLGALLAVRSDGLALLAVEEPLEAGRQALAGVPFDLSLRLATERAGDPAAALAALSTTTAHRVLALDLAAGTAWGALAALVGDGVGEVAHQDAHEVAPRARPAGSRHFGVERDGEGALWLLAATGFTPSGPVVGRLRVP